MPTGDPTIRCPRCDGDSLDPTTMQVHVNTGARYICTECGTPVNKDGSENEVLLRQPLPGRDAEDPARH